MRSASADGAKEVLGLWLEQNEGAKFWLRVMNELRNRGTEDILLAVVDGLKGFPEAITAVFPDAIVQTCIVHLLRNSIDFVSWKDRKSLAAALKEIYRARTAPMRPKRRWRRSRPARGASVIPRSGRAGGATRARSAGSSTPRTRSRL